MFSSLLYLLYVNVNTLKIGCYTLSIISHQLTLFMYNWKLRNNKNFSLELSWETPRKLMGTLGSGYSYRDGHSCFFRAFAVRASSEYSLTWLWDSGRARPRFGWRLDPYWTHVNRYCTLNTMYTLYTCK